MEIINKNLVIFIVYLVAFWIINASTIDPKKVLPVETIAEIKAEVVDGQIEWNFNVNESYYQNNCAFVIEASKALNEYCNQ